MFNLRSFVHAPTWYKLEEWLFGCRLRCEPFETESDHRRSNLQARGGTESDCEFLLARPLMLPLPVPPLPRVHQKLFKRDLYDPLSYWSGLWINLALPCAWLRFTVSAMILLTSLRDRAPLVIVHHGREEIPNLPWFDNWPLNFLSNDFSLNVRHVQFPSQPFSSKMHFNVV